MKVERTYPDAQRLVRDYLAARMTALGRDVTVAVGLPATWTSRDRPHLQVNSDGVPVMRHPVSMKATIRVTAWSDSQTVSNELATLAMGVLLAVTHEGGMAGIRQLTGPLPAKDADNHAEVSYITVGVRLRSIAVV